MLAFQEQLKDPTLPANHWANRQTTMELIQNSLSSPEFWFKVFILVVLSPFWWPVVKAIYLELQRSLRGEGGIWAKDYTSRDLARLEERQGVVEDPLTSVPRGGRGTRGGPPPPSRSSAAGGVSRASGSAGRSGPIRSQRVRRF